jgi:hypothetical protein
VIFGVSLESELRGTGVFEEADGENVITIVNMAITGRKLGSNGRGQDRGENPGSKGQSPK